MPPGGDDLPALIVERSGVNQAAAEGVGGDHGDRVARQDQSAGGGGGEGDGFAVGGDDLAGEAVAIDQRHVAGIGEGRQRAGVAEDDLADLVALEGHRDRDVGALPSDDAGGVDAGETAVDLVAVGEAQQIVRYGRRGFGGGQRCREGDGDGEGADHFS